MSFQLKGNKIDVLYSKGKLGYTFEFEGKNYGNAVPLTTSKRNDIISATFLLLENALETYEAVKQLPNENK